MRGEHSQLFLSDARPYFIVLVVGLRQLCNKLVLISLSSSRTALVQLLHLVLNEMQSHWRVSWSIVTAAGWKSDCVFAKFYNKPLESKSFSEVVLTHL